MKTFNVSVLTQIYRKDGSLFVDLGTMYWPGVDEEVVSWLAASCKTTAFWLINMPEVTSYKSYTLKYRTIVTDLKDNVVSDTTLLEFENLDYESVIKFEEWALAELREMLTMFNAKHNSHHEITKKRSKIKTIFKTFISVIENKLK